MMELDLRLSQEFAEDEESRRAADLSSPGFLCMSKVCRTRLYCDRLTVVDIRKRCAVRTLL